MAVKETDNPVNNARPIHATPRLGSPALRQPTFEGNVTGKHHLLCNFEIELKKFS